MTRDEIIAAGAERLIQAHRQHRSIPVPSDIPLAEEADAYAIQERVSASLGTHAGWKLGGIVRGETPRYSRMFVEHCQASPGAFRRRDHHLVYLEPELAVVLGEAIPARATPYTLAEIAPRVAGLHAALELVDSRFEGWPEVPALWQLADGLSHGGFVLGSGIAPGGLDQLVDAEYRLTLDGQVALAGRGDHPGGDPAALLVETVNARIARDGEGFAAGEIITTGTFDGVVEMLAGQQARLVFAGIGEVVMHLDP